MTGGNRTIAGNGTNATLVHWDSTQFVLTITFGASSGTGTFGTVTSTSNQPSYTNTTALDSAGNLVSNSPVQGAGLF